jgi:bifunctional UDP-N-acetylglucosamine pyrophosphorylase / glucosamine-1-phosphate N-acetyltransferase
MVLHVLDALAELPLQRAVVVIGHGGERISKTLGEKAPPGLALEFVEQAVQKGTGDAVAVGLTAFDVEPIDGGEVDGDVVVLPGDAPLLRPATLAALVREHRRADAAATLLTARLADPTGYGRVVRGRDGRVARVVEQVDASPEEAAVDEINTSIYAFRRSVLAPALRRLSPDNAKGEYYLTDVIAVLHDAGYPVATMVTPDPSEAAGVNDRAQLAAAEAELRDRINERWMRRGVTMLDPEHTYVDTGVTLGIDVTLYPGVLLRGATTIGAGAEVGPGCHLVDTTVGEGAALNYTVATSAYVGAGAQVGPWATLPPGSRIQPDTVTGPCHTGEMDHGQANAETQP